MANSGWTNDAVDSLTVPTGATSGERVIIANQSNGDAIDVYNTANKLVFSIDSTGKLTSVSSVDTAEVVISAGSVVFEDTGITGAFFPFLNGSITADQNALSIAAGAPLNAPGTVAGSAITLLTGDTTASEQIQVEQRGIVGNLVQTDNVGNSGQVIHAAAYSGTTDGAGHLIFNHGCAFTPAGAVVTGRAPAVGIFPNLTIGTDGFTSTQANLTFTVASTGAAYATQPVMFQAIFFG